MSQRRIVVIGGVAGGASFAARMRRLDENAQIIMLERGPYISFANCGLPYHVGNVIKNRDSLVLQTPESFHQRFHVDVRVHTEAVSIQRQEKRVKVRHLISGQEEDISYDILVLSPGAEAVRPAVPGVDLPGIHTLRNLPDMDGLLADIRVQKASRAVVVGGGFIGIEAAENLHEAGLKVSLVEFADQVMPNLDREFAAALERELTFRGVSVRTATRVAAFERTASGLSVQLSSGETLPADVVVLAAGVKPEVSLAVQAGLQIGPRGGIQVDRQMRTSDSSIFAVGDAVEAWDRNLSQPSRIPLAGPANRQGRLVADIVAGRDVAYSGAQGTSIVKVFSLAAASTGLTEKQAKQQGIVHEIAWIHANSHAGYYPGATPLLLKLVFAPKTGKLLGAQIVGRDGVDKRMDVLSTAVAAGMTAFDLETLDLSYAPPFSSAKDPVNHLGAVAAGMIRGDHQTISWQEMTNLNLDENFLLDVRTGDEFAMGSIPGAVNIPLDSLRDRLDELPRNKRLVLFCQIGLRGYLAHRILAQKGLKSVNLLGGYKLWQLMFKPASPVASVAKVSHEQQVVLTNSKTLTLDVCGLSCPGPILRVKKAMDEMAANDVLDVVASDPGFAADIPAWAQRTGHELLEVKPEGRLIRARLRKRETSMDHQLPVCPTEQGQTIVVFSGELDRALASLIIATGGASVGKKVTLFFTFWGLNLLRKNHHVSTRKNFIERMFGTMMPRGTLKARLSKMHFAGAGTAMMRSVMKEKNVPSLDEMFGTAKTMGIRFVACQMSMDVMGIKKEELMEGVEIGGVASYLDAASDANINLFI